MPIVPINDDYSNIAEFIDSLFDPDVRTPDAIVTAGQAGQLIASYSSESAKIVSVWTAAWQQAQGLKPDPTDLQHCPAGDLLLIQWLSSYISLNNLSLFVPSLAYLGLSGDSGPPIYRLDAYQRFDFQGQAVGAAIGQLLELLLYGAHVVVIHDPANLPPNVRVDPFYEMFTGGALAHQLRRDPGNSHYTSLVNLCGYYYPSITQNSAPQPSPFFLSFLAGPTVMSLTCSPSSYNTFFQLEGWEAVSARHEADYTTYKQTLWNISTFGACAYSEKRATAVFLAPVAWDPQPTPGTFMPPYVGAATAQPWLNTALIRLGSSSL